MTVLAWVCLAVGLIPLAARDRRSSWHVVVIAACLAPGVVITAGVAACLFAWRGQPWGLVVAFAEFYLFASRLLFAERPPRVTGQRSTVLTLNLRLGLADPDAVLDLLRSTHPDLLMLQELTPEALTGLDAAGLAEHFEHRFTEPHPQGSGIGLFGHRPLEDRRSHDGFVNHVLSARTTLADGTELTAVAAHLSAPWPQPAWRWRQETTRLGTVLAELPGPLVLGGDLNATVSHRVFRDVLAGGTVRDAVRRPTVRTFPARLPLLGIDHVLLRDLGVGRVRTADVTGSDHRALIVEVGP